LGRLMVRSGEGRRNPFPVTGPGAMPPEKFATLKLHVFVTKMCYFNVD